MIHAVRASDKRFREVTFTPGLNVILADRTAQSKDTDTRNGVGKSLLFAVIDYCLGASPSKGQTVRRSEFEEWDFSLDLTLDRRTLSVTRSPRDNGKVRLRGDTMGLPLRPKIDEKSGEKALSVTDWKACLGSVMFGIPHDPAEAKYRPTFRSVLSYFIRRGHDAYESPFRHTRQQKTWDVQVNNAFLLNLDWYSASDLQRLRDKEAALKGLQKAIDENVLAGVVGSIGELEAEKVRLEKDVKQQKQALEGFNVLPNYRDIQQKANTLTREISELNNRLVLLERSLARYRESMAEEAEPDVGELENVYREAGVVFGSDLRKTLDDAVRFHKRLVRNRRAFLASEISQTETTVADLQGTREKLVIERAELMGVLQQHGALEEYSRLQDLVTQSQERLERVRTRIDEVRKIQSERRQIKVDRISIQQRAEREHDERRSDREDAVRRFQENTEYLYGSPADLVIDLGEAGYSFNAEVERKGSDGVEKMTIFCYDLVLAERWSKRPGWLGALCHDSLVFDGVDSRQRAKALELAALRGPECGFQYICAINSDEVPTRDFSPSVNFAEYVRIRLKDQPEDQSLFGFRF